MFLTEGFSYGSIVITMSILTYSEYEERSYNLTDSFDSDDIPANPANGLFPLVLFVVSVLCNGASKKVLYRIYPWPAVL